MDLPIRPFEVNFTFTLHCVHSGILFVSEKIYLTLYQYSLGRVKQTDNTLKKELSPSVNCYQNIYILVVSYTDIRLYLSVLTLYKNG